MINHLEHPYAWLNLDALDANIQFVNEQAMGKPIRIATKSIRSVEVLKYIEKKLRNCSGFMTYTAAETNYLLEQGFNHLLIGYPVYEQNSIKKIVNHIKQGADVTFMIDHEEQVKLLQNIAEQLNVKVPVCIDINVSTDFSLIYFGTKRSPINSIEKLDQLIRQLKKYNFVNIVGAMGYDAQIAGVTDQFDSAIKTKLVKVLKNKSIRSVNSLRQQAVYTLKENNSLSFVNAGGSGSIALCSKQSDVTEITVGSAFFTPHLFDRYDSLSTNPAIGFALRVVRQYSKDTYVLQGGGYIASGAIGKDRLPQFIEKERFSFLELEGAGEVQTPIVDKDKALKIGDTVLLRHAKSGELCERFLTLHGVRGSKGEQYERPFSTYRGDGQCFL